MTHISLQSIIDKHHITKLLKKSQYKQYYNMSTKTMFCTIVGALFALGPSLKRTLNYSTRFTLYFGLFRLYFCKCLLSETKNSAVAKYSFLFF